MASSKATQAMPHASKTALVKGVAFKWPDSAHQIRIGHWGEGVGIATPHLQLG